MANVFSEPIFGKLNFLIPFYHRQQYFMPVPHRANGVPGSAVKKPERSFLIVTETIPENGVPAAENGNAQKEDSENEPKTKRTTGQWMTKYFWEGKLK
jgi:hypothetical protein